MKIQICYIFEEATQFIENATSFEVIQVKNFKIFIERPSLVMILASVNGTLSKNGAFSNDLKGVIMKFFPGPPFLLASLAPRFSFPNMNFVPTGLVQSHTSLSFQSKPKRTSKVIYFDNHCQNLLKIACIERQ